MRTRGKLLIGAAVLAFAAAALLWRAGSGVQPQDTTGAANGDAAPPAAMARDPGPEAPTPSPVAREEVPPGVAAEPAHAAPELLFVGRCVAAEDGRPLGGVEVAFAPTLHLEARAGIAALRGEPEAATTRTTTGADGRFELPGNRSRAWVHTLTFEAKGRVRVEGVPHGEIAGRVDLGDVPLPLGVVAHARVVDEQGQPQDGVRVVFHATEGATITPWLRVRREFATRANADGTLPLPVLAPGRYGVGCNDRELVGPRQWNVAAGAPPFDVVVNGAPETITGVVVDPQGAPLAEVAVQPAERERYYGAVPYTNASGRFVVARRSTDRPDPHRLRLSKPGWRTLESEPVAWGTQDLRFTLTPAHSLEVQVVDAVSGAPVEVFGVRVASPRIVFHEWRMTEGVLRQVDRHPGGRVRVLLEDGPQRLWVQPGSGHAPSDPVDVVGSEAMPAQVVVRLEPLAPRTVRVVDGAGTPIAGSTVEVLRPGDEGAQDRGHAVLDDEDMQWEVWPRREGAPRPWLRLAKARTGAEGTAALSVSPREELEVRVEGPAHCPFARRVVFADEPDPLQVEVAGGATLAGSIVPADFAVRMQALGGRNAPRPRCGCCSEAMATTGGSRRPTCRSAATASSASSTCRPARGMSSRCRGSPAAAAYARRCGCRSVSPVTCAKAARASCASTRRVCCRARCARTCS